MGYCEPIFEASIYIETVTKSSLNTVLVLSHKCSCLSDFGLTGESTRSPGFRPAEETNPHVTSFLSHSWRLHFNERRKAWRRASEKERARAQSHWREPDEVTVVMGFKLNTAERLKAEIHTNMRL